MRAALLLLFASFAPADELSEAVDAPSPEARRVAALKLADTPLETLLARMRAFPAAPGETENVYLPGSCDSSRPAPLLLALHGTGGQGEEVIPIWRAVADALGMVVLAPSDRGKNDGYGWTPQEREEALNALRAARRHLNIDENRIHVTGISRGGHMAWDLALRHPDLFASLAPMIGCTRISITNGQNNLRYIESLLSLPIRDLQGSKDDPLLIWNLHLAFRKLESLKAKDARLFEFPELGHSFEFGAVNWTEFFGGARREPVPKRVVYACARPGRAFWVEVTKLAPSAAEVFVPEVVETRWKGMSEEARRLFMHAEAERRTARIEATMEAPGRFTVKSNRIAQCRLLLAEGMFLPGLAVEVKYNGSTLKRTVMPRSEIALLHFVERFDRTFIPVAEITLP